MDAVRIGNVTITPVVSRHLGKVESGLQHVSFIIEGSRCVWFLGDAAPIQWKNRGDLPRPDVLIAPYAYGNSKAAWDLSCSLAKKMVMLHLPERNQDPYGLWSAVEQNTAGESAMQLWIPEMGERITI